MTNAEVMGLFKSCPEISVFELSRLYSSPMPPQLRPMVVPKLRDLKLVTYSELYGTIFDYLIIPRLVCLETRHMYDFPTTASLSYFSDFLIRSSCRIMKFILSVRVSSEDQLLEVLASPAIQRIEELGLNAHITDRTVQSLTRTGGCQTHLLPSLRSISLKQHHTSDGVLSDMVISRLPLLKFFNARLPPNGGPTDDLTVIDSLREQGYDFYLT